METFEQQAQELAATINESKLKLIECALSSRENLLRIQLQVEEFKEEFQRLQDYSELQEIHRKSQQLSRYTIGLEYVSRLAEMVRIKYKRLTRDRILSLLQQQESVLAIEALLLFKNIKMERSDAENVLGPLGVHLSRTFDPAYDAIVDFLENDWLKALEEIGWPSIQKDRVSLRFVQSVLSYCKLRVKSYYVSHEELIHPLFYGARKSFEINFAFHFKGKKKTNQLNKVSLFDVARVLYAVCS
jgi:hypothetical protein